MAKNKVPCQFLAFVQQAGVSLPPNLPKQDIRPPAQKPKAVASPKPEQIFLGNGDHSGAECYKLYAMLGEAIETLGGIQQGCNKELYEEGQAEVEKIAREIYTRLTGNLISGVVLPSSRVKE